MGRTLKLLDETEDKTAVLNIRIPAALRNQVIVEAKLFNVTVADVVVYALEEYSQTLERRRQENALVLEREIAALQEKRSNLLNGLTLK